MKIEMLRKTLRMGSIVFGLSALLLVLLPGFFNWLLGLSTNPDLEWAMRMIGITLVALAGNMYSVSKHGSEKSVSLSGRVMQISAFLLGVLTLLIPTQMNWFTISYAIVGFGFSAAYTFAFLRSRK
jgi:O-antigen/teichoic acid export membrane protein